MIGIFLKSKDLLLGAEYIEIPGDLIKKYNELGYDVNDLEEREVEPHNVRELMRTTLEKMAPYQTLRVREYPSIGDQLDALFHAGVFPEDMAAKIQAVKNKYPKS